MNTDDRIRRLAKWYYDRLHQDTRTNGDKFYKFCAKVSPDGKEDESLPSHEEERCRALAFAVHGDGDMLPEDWRYEFLNESLVAIMDAFDFDEIELEADIYNADLTRWLGSHCNRPGYCDEAVSEGLCDGSDMMTTIQCGQYLEKREVLAATLQHLRDEADAEEQEELEAEESAQEQE